MPLNDDSITYEEVFLWRDICEKMAQKPGELWEGEELIAAVPGCDSLVGFDRTRRQVLWDAYKIQLIKWVKFRRNDQGWRLKSNWEDKIDFLERVYILNQNPDELPRPWLDKYEKAQRLKQRNQKFVDLEYRLRAISVTLKVLEDYAFMHSSKLFDLSTDPGRGLLKAQLQAINKNCQLARSLCYDLREPGRQAAVLGGQVDGPRPGDMVLGGRGRPGLAINA